eukprot:771975_1
MSVQQGNRTLHTRMYYMDSNPWTRGIFIYFLSGQPIKHTWQGHMTDFSDLFLLCAFFVNFFFAPRCCLRNLRFLVLCDLLTLESICCGSENSGRACHRIR